MPSNSKVIIGIPVYNDLFTLKATIKSILESTEFPYEIVLVESESTDRVGDYCDYLATRYAHVRVFHTKKEGPLKAYNFLFALAQKEQKDLLLSQTDVCYPKLFMRDWLRDLHDATRQEHVSIATCLNGGGVSGPDYYDNFQWVVGWCTYIPVKTINAIGGFDEEAPNGWGVDIDYSYRACQLGKLAFVNYWVDHHKFNAREHEQGDQTKIQEDMAKASAYFRKKWGLGEFSKN